jgi:3-phenylpropionate/trans-cinnamate dioxygenase ferredoxin reductase component
MTASTSTGTTPVPASPDGEAVRTGILIIGASQSGVQLAVSLRALGYDEHITLLGDEDHRPYQRPALSKEFLQDKVDKESLIFRSNEYWAEHNVTLVKGARIKSIEKNDDGSGTARAADGTEYPFKRLALTVGARARKLELPGRTWTASSTCATPTTRWP